MAAINIPIFTQFVDKGIKQAEAAFGKMKGSLLLAGAAIAGVTAVATTFGVKAVKAASDFNEETAKTEVIFGAISAEVKDFARTTARNLGIARTEALQAASTFATFGKSAGLAGKDLATFSTDFVTLAADLASFNNTNVSEAITALGAALRGENEPIRRYNVLIDDAALKTAALELGIYRGTGALKANQKVLAAQKVIYDQTGDAQGDFARTSGGLAGQMKILKATIEDVQTNLGRALIPVVQKLVTWFNNHVTPAVERVAEAIGEDGLGAGVQQMIAEFKRAGIDITPVLKGLTLSAAAFANVLYRVAQIGKSGFEFASGKFVESFKSLKEATSELIDIDKIGAQFDAFAKGVYDAGGRMSYGSYYAKMLAETAKSLGDETDPENPKGAGGKVKRFSELVKEGLRDALKSARSDLEKAQQAFADFAQSVADSITSALDFGAAKEAGTETGKGFLAGLRDQVRGITDYAGQLKQLLQMGLSRDALQQVLDAGNEAGAAIAGQLISGGQTAIDETNALVESAQNAANEIGLQAASNFMQAGIDSAQNIINGLTSKIKELKPKLMAQMDKLAASLKRTVNIDVEVTKKVKEIIEQIPAMGTGGIVTKPTLALVGEAGPEAVVPLSAMGRFGGNVTVNINGGFATTAEIGEAVINSIRQYNQVQGPAAIAVA